MAKSKPSTEPAPVDHEDDDRREPSAALDESRGLAARILDLRRLVETNRQAQVKEHHQQQSRIANLEQQFAALNTRVDQEVVDIRRMQRELQDALHQGGEQVRQAGQLARKITDGMKELEELRAVASDPHEVVKPLQRAIGSLRADLQQLAGSVDIRFENMPKPRREPVESRGEDEEALVKLGAEIRKLRERVKALEPAN